MRGIWELLAGWYHYDSVANLYHVPPSAIDADLVDLAGGADALAVRARAYLDRKMPLEALRLLDVARGSETRKVLRARIDALEMLLSSAKAGPNNYSEVGLLGGDLRASKQRLEGLAE